METKIIKVTNKGQISLPIKIRNLLNIKQGDELLMVNEGNSLVLRKVKKEDFSDLLKHSEKTAKKLWDNKEDEIWNTL